MNTCFQSNAESAGDGPDFARAQELISPAGRPHNPEIAHLTTTHSLPATAGKILQAFLAGKPFPNLTATLEALSLFRDTKPDSPTYGCLKWFTEDPVVYDTNASFFVCTPLTGLWLGFRDRLAADELTALTTLFRHVLPWFLRMSEAPSLFYPNKCISDAGMLLASGHILGEEEIIARGRSFCQRYFDYYRRRGTGWGEDHSPVYTKVICDATLLIMALEKSGGLFAAARAMTDAIMEWAMFHDGLDAVPSIRGYNFAARVRVPYAVAALAEPQSSDPPGDLFALLRGISGYRFAAGSQPVPRQRRWRTFDAHFSTTFIAERNRLGTLSEFPLMPNSYMHDGWGLGWQTKPCSFIVGDREYGILEWYTEDSTGLARQHEAAEGTHNQGGRHLFSRLGFHPEVITVSHQEGPAAIVLREIHRLHSPTRLLVDRWRLAPGTVTLRAAGTGVAGDGPLAAGTWLTLDYGDCAVALRPLACRRPAAPDRDPNPQRRWLDETLAPVPFVQRTDRGLYIGVSLVDDSAGDLCEHLLFSGWCVVLLRDFREVDRLRVEESFLDDGEIPRTYGELIRTVSLQTPDAVLTLRRDPLTRETERQIDGNPFHWTAGA